MSSFGMFRKVHLGTRARVLRATVKRWVVVERDVPIGRVAPDVRTRVMGIYRAGQQKDTAQD